MNTLTILPKKLNAWYRKNARKLPWRETSDPYKIWISEIMLQQTTVAAVIPYYLKWIEKYPTIQDVAKEPLEKILKTWQGLGYYQRAKNIHKSAIIISQEFNGEIPSNPEILKTLPGFGPYTVGAVLSIAFDRRIPIIDANVRRVFMRILKINGLANASQDTPILQCLTLILPKRNLRTFNQALMELGALICRNKEPICNKCPIKLFCKAYADGIQEIIPEPKKTAIKNITAVIAIIQKNKKYFVQKRTKKGLLADLWEFPGGKVEENESLIIALKREIKEELNIEIIKAKSFTKVIHYYTQFKVNLNVYFCDVSPFPSDDENHKWASIKNLHLLPMPSGSARILDKLEQLIS